MEEKYRKDLPVIGITMGDPAGIGPEIIIKVLSQSYSLLPCIPVIVGDSVTLERAARFVGWDGHVHCISGPEEARYLPNHIQIIVPEGLGPIPCEPGRPTVQGGKASAMFIEEAVSLAMKGRIGAVVTCPINKAMLNSAGYGFEGHTQMIASLTGCNSYVMMLAGERLRVALVTIHVPLVKVPELITVANVYKTIAITHKALVKDFALSRPRIGVAALNPHAGEKGLFGREEEDVINPAVQKARAQGMSVEGPFPADTLFWRAFLGEFDAVVAMYHDQGLGPLKLIHFDDAVNITLGLPIVRTSVDHGTAYELAGTGRANHTSLLNALKMAATMVCNRNR